MESRKNHLFDSFFDSAGDVDERFEDCDEPDADGPERVDACIALAETMIGRREHAKARALLSEALGRMLDLPSSSLDGPWARRALASCHRNLSTVNFYDLDIAATCAHLGAAIRAVEPRSPDDPLDLLEELALSYDGLARVHDWWCIEGPGGEASRAEEPERVLAGVDACEKRANGDPGIETLEELARQYERAACAVFRDEKWRAERASFRRRALDAWERLLALQPNAEGRADVLANMGSCLVEAGGSALDANDRDEAEDLLGRAVAYAKVACDAGGAGEAWKSLCFAYGELGRLAESKCNHAEACELYGRAIACWEAQVQADDELDDQMGLIRLYRGLEDAAAAAGLTDVAEGGFAGERRAIRRCPDDGFGRQGALIVGSYVREARQCEEAGHVERAEELCAKALEGCGAAAGASPMPQFRGYACSSHLILGRMAAKADCADDARSHFERAIAVAKKACGRALRLVSLPSRAHAPEGFGSRLGGCDGR